MSRPRLLEGCACEGGATAGYRRAGWHVTAVDLDKNRLRYNPADEIVHGDAIDYMLNEGHKFDAVHLSPNCQWYTRGRAKDRGQPTKWERSIPTFRDAAIETGLPYVIENVPDAAWDMVEPVALCGCMFDLSTLDLDLMRIHLKRERMFETNWTMTAPRECDHSRIEWWAGAYGGARRDRHEAKFVRKGGYVPKDKGVVQALLGIEHDMTWRGLFESIPPAYAHHVGTQLLAHIEQEKAA